MCVFIVLEQGTSKRDCPKRTSNNFKTIKFEVTARISPLNPLKGTLSRPFRGGLEG